MLSQVPVIKRKHLVPHLAYKLVATKSFASKTAIEALYTYLLLQTIALNDSADTHCYQTIFNTTNENLKRFKSLMFEQAELNQNGGKGLWLCALEFHKCTTSITNLQYNL